MRTLLRIVCLLAVVLAVPGGASAQISDRSLAERVGAKVRDYEQFSIFDDVNISVDTGTVTLSGCVTMLNKRDEIGARVAKMDGVRRLVNDLRVLPVSLADSDLRVRVAQAIYGHPAFWPYAAMARPPIHIIVEAGRVTLTGTVSSEVERSLAYALAQVPGAFGVTNGLRVDKDPPM
jgi:hyperosmotically inducible protein